MTVPFVHSLDACADAILYAARGDFNCSGSCAETYQQEKLVVESLKEKCSMLSNYRNRVLAKHHCQG